MPQIALDEYLGAAALAGIASWLNLRQRNQKARFANQNIPFLKDAPDSVLLAGLVIGIDAFAPDMVPPQYRETFRGARSFAVGLATEYMVQHQGLGMAKFPTLEEPTSTRVMPFSTRALVRTAAPVSLPAVLTQPTVQRIDDLADSLTAAAV